MIWQCSLKRARTSNCLRLALLSCATRRSAWGVIPKAEQESAIQPRRVILFTASHILKAKLNHTAPRRRRMPSKGAAGPAEAQYEAAD